MSYSNLFYILCRRCCFFFFFFQAEDGIRDYKVTGVQTCALPISSGDAHTESAGRGERDVTGVELECGAHADLAEVPHPVVRPGRAEHRAGVPGDRKSVV